MRLIEQPGFDVGADMEAIADHAAALRTLFRPAKVCYTPEYFASLVSQLDDAEQCRLYLVIRPKKPIALAIIPGLSHDDVVELMALSNLGEGPGTVYPMEGDTGDRRRMARQAREEGPSRGVFAFILGEPQGIMLLELDPEGLVMAMARFGARNLLDPEPIMAQRMRLLRLRIEALAEDMEGDA